MQAILHDSAPKSACLTDLPNFNTHPVLQLVQYTKLIKEDKKAMIRNRYNRTPHPAPNTKRERGTHYQDGTEIKTAQVKSQGDSSFPTDGHKTVLINWTVSQRQTESGRTLTIRINHKRSIALERSVIWGLKLVLRSSNHTLGSVVVHIHIEVVRSAWRNSGPNISQLIKLTEFLFIFLQYIKLSQLIQIIVNTYN